MYEYIFFNVFEFLLVSTSFHFYLVHFISLKNYLIEKVVKLTAYIVN